MTLEITPEPLSAAAYAREVLPETFALWGGGRDFARYAADIRTTDRSERARRPFFTYGIRAGGAVVASCKTYERSICFGATTLNATGIGAVFTPPPQRGRGYASLMLGALLDRERAAGCDAAYLYSDIHPAFYERLGFVQLPSRAFRIRASKLDATRVGQRVLRAEDWPALRRCFHALDDARPWSFERTRTVWARVRKHWESPPPPKAQRVRLGVRAGREIVAYVTGVRHPRDDEFYLLEAAFSNESGRAKIPGLLRAAAGDLRNIAGWVPPPIARDALRGTTVRARKDAIFMVAPLTSAARTWLGAIREMQAGADATWYADHV